MTKRLRIPPVVVEAARRRRSPSFFVDYSRADVCTLLGRLSFPSSFTLWNMNGVDGMEERRFLESVPALVATGNEGKQYQHATHRVHRGVPPPHIVLVEPAEIEMNRSRIRLA